MSATGFLNESNHGKNFGIFWFGCLFVPCWNNINDVTGQTKKLWLIKLILKPKKFI